MVCQNHLWANRESLSKVSPNSLQIRAFASATVRTVAAWSADTLIGLLLQFDSLPNARCPPPGSRKATARSTLCHLCSHSSRQTFTKCLDLLGLPGIFPQHLIDSADSSAPLFTECPKYMTADTIKSISDLRTRVCWSWEHLWTPWCSNRVFATIFLKNLL